MKMLVVKELYACLFEQGFHQGQFFSGLCQHLMNTFQLSILTFSADTLPLTSVSSSSAFDLLQRGDGLKESNWSMAVRHNTD